MAAAAPSPLASSVETTNEMKLFRLLFVGGTTALRNVFDRYHPPANLAARLNANYVTLNNLSRRKVLNRRQWDLLFPPGGTTPDSKTFDIILLFLLLTNICGLSPPRSGWHKPPHSSDRTLEANLVRIKLYRNELYGSPATGVQTSVFNVKWQELSAVLVALGLNCAEVVRFKSAPLGEDYNISTVIEKRFENDMEIKSQVEELRKSIIEVRPIQEEYHKTLQDTQVVVEGVWQIQKDTHEVIKEIYNIQTKPQETVEEVRLTQLDDPETLHDSNSKLDEVLDSEYQFSYIGHDLLIIVNSQINNHV